MNGLLEGMRLSSKGGDYKASFKRGTDAAYRYDDANAAFNASEINKNTQTKGHICPSPSSERLMCPFFILRKLSISQMKFLIQPLAIGFVRSNPTNVIHPLLRQQNLDEPRISFIRFFLSAFLCSRETRAIVHERHLAVDVFQPVFLVLQKMPVASYALLIAASLIASSSFSL